MSSDQIQNNKHNLYQDQDCQNLFLMNHLYIHIHLLLPIHHSAKSITSLSSYQAKSVVLLPKTEEIVTLSTGDEI